jgi:hypothetical protein
VIEKVTHGSMGRCWPGEAIEGGAACAPEGNDRDSLACLRMSIHASALPYTLARRRLVVLGLTEPPEQQEP